ncbi:BadF/BadG/BcrA/BcrD ATPase family protein [Bacillus sp. V2I10]|uniref:BadF/BadG/BcrA/BcrD ATPase family protein n=1 Tax=Bacillus sp. V2I10 TaxID=3042276 RepID=UPI002780CC03|nr:BadF/BadG/BcrA/BcrD ATPase family protein [Bacillus sp. V2I10]MDQ0862320.1 N-acetylglucosamine kinase-like BadF-type ATPase [Bacillus sp. V2I10]
MNNSTFPLLAVDGGGTKTLAVVTDSTGKVMGIGRSNASNYQVAGIEEAKNALIVAIEEVLIKICKKDQITFQTGVFALAGIDTSEDRDIVHRIIINACIQCGINIEKIIIENDALSTLIGATSNRPGALVISGTGSIAFAHNGKGEYVRAGGWGHKVGDEGSGYWIGKEAIRSILMMSDGRGPNTILRDKVLKALSLPTVEALYNWIYGANDSVDTISEIAQIVEVSRREGDSVSHTILDAASDELFLLLFAVMEKTLNTHENNTIILQGGILKHNQYIQKRLSDKVKNQFPNSRLITANLEPYEYIVQRGILNNEQIND